MFLWRAFLLLITLAWLGCLMSVKLLLPLCALDGMSEALIGWDQVTITSARQWVERERERCTPSEDCQECEKWRVLHNRRRGETRPAPSACLGPGPLMEITKASTQRQSGRHFQWLAFTSWLFPSRDAVTILLLGKLRLIPCMFQNWKQWLVDVHPACAALTVLYRRKITLTFAQKLSTLPMNSNQHQNIGKPGEKK